MKILSVCTNFPTAEAPHRGLFVARRLSEMAKRVDLRALNPEPWFPVVRPWESAHAKPDNPLPVDVRKMFYFPKYAKGLDSFWMDRCVLRWFREIGEEATRGAILDAHFGYPEGVGCARLAKRLGMPCFITIRGLEVDRFQVPNIKSQLVESLTHCTGTIAVSDSLRDAAIDAGVPDENITVIPNGIDGDLFCVGDRNTARMELQQSTDRPLVVCVANFKAVKGHEILMRAFAKLPRKLESRLVLIGAPSDANVVQHIDHLVESLGISGYVNKIGSRSPDEVAKWLQAADVFALASHREGCCNAVLEALATGTPVVATAVGSNPQEIRHAIDGFVVPVGDSDAFGEALQTALERDWNSEQISSRLTGRTWAGVADRVLQFMDSRIR
ncbi:glycosyltransferase [Allorhodopirellula heiligendammensis]|uniref:D-inositol 3-phosphate glycosyltransferase n=1 Tax=Allorhodopirellula heiligendammensis TaxID=2714739 RepID=A0A5C6C7K3_9BACT|nr:glycosyltransferase [Allorhodopirellula heiligendammensis]TWU19997.1 D-inositol 3-phosphate glycosyltransferase [Allorhodopirellula heiligendammensis]